MSQPTFTPPVEAVVYYEDQPPDDQLDDAALIQQLVDWAAPIIARVATSPAKEPQSTGRRAA